MAEHRGSRQADIILPDGTVERGTILPTVVLEVSFPSRVAEVIGIMKTLSSEEVLEVMGEFCKGCGGPARPYSGSRRCQRENDE